MYNMSFLISKKYTHIKLFFVFRWKKDMAKWVLKYWHKNIFGHSLQTIFPSWNIFCRSIYCQQYRESCGMNWVSICAFLIAELWFLIGKCVIQYSCGTNLSDSDVQCLSLSRLYVHNTVQSVIQGSFSTMTSWNGNIFRDTGPLCGEFTGHRWIPLKGEWRGA